MKKRKLIEVESEFLELFEKGKKYDEICKILNVSKSSISKYVKEHNLIHPSKRKNINECAFDEISEESAYWLGFLWADGYVQNTERNTTIDLEVTDLDHAEKFQKFLNIPKINVRNRHNSITYRTNCSSKKLVNRLIELGFDLKDNRTNLPDIPEEYMIVFLRGYFDGDGHIRIHNERLEGIDISGREEFIDNLMNKFSYFIRKEKHSLKSARIYSSVESGKQFLKDIYRNATIYLNRKFKCALSLCE